MSGQQKPQCLVVILDTNAEAWKLASHSFDSVLESLLSFLNAFAILHQRNRIAVISSGCDRGQMLYPSKEDPSPRSNMTLIPTVVAGLKKIFGGAEESNSAASSKLSSAIALALCYLQSMDTADCLSEPRIFIVQASKDVPAQYISTMNCIFAAQRMEAYIDACVFGAEDSIFLQQACHITDGVYWRVSHTQKALLQYFLTAFLPGRATRCTLQLPQPEKIDLRAMCFDRKEPVELANVCSVCLSIFSKEMPNCATCGVEFQQPWNK